VSGLRAAALLALLAAPGCAVVNGISGGGDDDDDTGPTRTRLLAAPAEFNPDIDILFVIDNSGSMAEEQSALTGGFQSFVEGLEDFPGGAPNMHIGVVSSNVGAGAVPLSGCGGEGDDGALQATARGACTPPTGAFISDVLNPDGVTRAVNYTGTLSDSFACIAELGTEGCGFEQHFESMKRALDGSVPANVGFLRPGANLAVIILADEDDCSVSNGQMFDPDDVSTLGPLTSFRCTEFGVECDGATIARSPAAYQNCVSREGSSFMPTALDYADFLRGLDADRIFVGAIVGNPGPFEVAVNGMGEPNLLPSCNSPSGEAAPAIRIVDLLSHFPAASLFTSICDASLAVPLADIVEAMASAFGASTCLLGDPSDIDFDEPGLQPDCHTFDVQELDEASEQRAEIENCDFNGGAMPCFTLIQDPTCTSTANMLRLSLARDASPPADTIVVVECL
jgi:hypothetical protein